MDICINRSPITLFYSKIKDDERILATHVSLFTAIYDNWIQNEFAYPVSITRKELMGKAKIRSIATYHKCITNLHQWGYLKYQPSYNPCGSEIQWIVGEKSSEC